MINKGYITEIFFSVQGEGIFVGTPQIFVRFAECNLNCSYCDTPKSRYKKYAREYTPQKLIEEIKRINKFNARSVSFTGGEPLLQVEFIKIVIPHLKKMGLEIYLETNGTLPQALKQVVGMVDVISMDFKLLSSCGKDLIKIHKEFLEVGKNKTFIKLPLTDKTTFIEIKTVVSTIEKVSPKIPLILQPVTKQKNVSPSQWNKIFSWYLWARQNSHLKSVRILPQQHHSWGLQ